MDGRGRLLSAEGAKELSEAIAEGHSSLSSAKKPPKVHPQLNNVPCGIYHLF